MSSTTRSASKAELASSPQHDETLWKGILGHLRQANPDICRQWFEELEPLGIHAGILYLRAHSQIHRDYLHRQCTTPFADATRVVSGRLMTVRFLGPEEHLPTDGPRSSERSPASELAPTRPPTEPGADQAIGDGQGFGGRLGNGASDTSAGGFGRGTGRIAPDEEALSKPFQPLTPTEIEHLYDDGLVLNPDYGFDHFVVGPSNRLAQAAAQAVAKSPGRAYNPFFVHGDVGLGKTHLLQSICLRIRESSPGAVIYYTSCEGFMTQFMDSVREGLLTRFRHKFRHVDVLVIDDIHFLAKRDRTQEEFFHTFNSLYQSHKQIILSSDAPPEEIPDLEDRLVSRFKWGLVTELAPPCYETRVEILKNKSRLRGIDLPDDVACYIAGKIDTNIRELEGAISKLQMIAAVEKRPINADLARLALGDDGAKAEPKIQIQTIINAVTDFYGVKMTDLQSKRRQRSIALPRQLCMYLARRNTRYSLEEIGGYFGGRDHTTVMHAVRTIDDRRETDEEFAGVIRALEDKLRAPA
ncbi:MAG: chromosomal replication initiator protein DnaA [Phycisphaerae bacterium]|nr:chromosomal replication initiator protein DnaA [Phycisphaerae bacterium]